MNINYPDDCIKVLNHGFIRLVDSMGCDNDIADSARVSYQKGTKTLHDNKGLIRYLLRHHHTTPFQQVTLKFHVRLPIFVARQWIRHRTQSFNEVSGRYSELADMFYVPDENKITKQSVNNKQGGSEELIEHSKFWEVHFATEQEQIYKDYEQALKSGMRRELARINLPVSLYTEWYVTADLHNWFHFLKLRLDSHAQYEIRVYAEAMLEIIRSKFPISVEAFEDYILDSIDLTRLDIIALKKFINNPDYNLDELYNNKREKQEFTEKLKKILE